MVNCFIVQKTCRTPVAYELQRWLREIQDNGLKVISVMETTLSNNEQGFIILYEGGNNSKDDKEWI